MKSIIRTDRPYNTEGRWWLPGKSGKKLPGILSFDPEGGGRLKLAGSLTFKDSSDVLVKALVSGFPSYSTVLGVANDGSRVTLFDTWVETPSIDAEQIRANTAVVGAHCRGRSAATFEAIRLRFRNLESWFEHHAFTRETAFKDHSALTASLKDSSYTEIQGTLPSIDATFECKRGLAGTIDHYKASCEYQAELWVHFNKRQSLDTCCEVSSKLQHLLGLLMGGPTFHYELHMVTSDSTRAAFLASWRTNVRLREIWNGQMPCSYQSIKGEFAGILDGWFKVHKSLDLVVTLLFEVLQMKGTVLEERFFNLAQAIEGLCAETIAFVYEPDDRIAEFKKSLIGAIPSGTAQGLRDRTKSWLEYANQPSLKGYLVRLFRGLDDRLKANVLGDWKEGEFVEYVKNTRNIIAHPSNGSVWQFTKQEEFLDALDRMKHLLVVLLLQRAGVPLEVLRNKYRDVKRWTWG